MSHGVCAATLVVLALLHSALGEARLLGPLFASALPDEAMPLGRRFTARTLRVAWHLLSVAWLGLAFVVMVGGAWILAGVGATLLVSGALALLVSRGRHFAWALFVVGGLAGLVGPHVDAVAPYAAGVAGLVLSGIAAVHVAWLFGAGWGIRAAIPEVAGRPAFVPPRALTGLVAAVLGGAGAVVLVAARVGSPFWAWVALAGAAVFGLRALGDFRLVGLTKRVLGTSFARWDDGLFTPLSLLLAVCFAIVAARGLA
jgi:hypothetical protein